MTNATISRKRQCLEDLRRRILTEELPPGAYLDEVALAGQYGLSRPPLREVVRELAGEGYIALHENRGAQVAPMNHRTLHDFFVAAPMIYAAVNRLAAENATSAQIEALKAVQAEFREAIRNGDGVSRSLANQRFHYMIGEMAGNEFLMPSLRRLLIDHTRIGLTFYAPRRRGHEGERSAAADQHDAMIAAIEDGDAEAAADLAFAHWELSRSQIESFVSPPAVTFSLGQPPRANVAPAAALPD